MTEEQIIMLIGGILIAAVLAVAIPFIIKDYRNNKENYHMTKERMREIEDERLADEGVRESFHAEVTDMICGTYTKAKDAYRLVESMREFYVKLRDDDGNIRDIAVGEDMYSAFEVGMVGVFETIDGRIDSFLLDGEDNEEDGD